MASLVINLRCLLFLLGLWSIVALSFTADPPPPTPSQKAQQENYIKYFKYLSRGIDIATASMEDIGRDPAKTWKKPIWKDCGTGEKFTGSPIPDTTLGIFLTPIYYAIEKSNDTAVSSVIYQTIEDLLPLLKPTNNTGAPNQFELNHNIELFENRFKATTPSRERTLNALTFIKVEQLKATVYPDSSPTDRKGKLHADFIAKIEKLIEKSKSFQEDSKLYLDFTNDYGTHYAYQASFGGILMINTKVAMNYKALLRSKEQLEKNLESLAEAILLNENTIPADAQHSTELFHELLFFGGTASSQTEEAFDKEMHLNRTISRVVVKPLWDLINMAFKESKTEKLATVVKALQEVEQVQLFRYELYRWKAAFEVAKASEFQETALGYRDVNNLAPYIDYYLKNTTKMPYPEKGNETAVWATHLSQMFKWPLEYQIGLRGSLAF